MSAITNIKCTSFSWTDSNFNIAKDLYQKGIRASIIAKELGTTKNAVLGKMHRHKLSTPSVYALKNINKSSNTYFKQYGEANCLICKKKYKTYSKFDRFCSPCKSRDFYKHLT